MSYIGHPFSYDLFVTYSHGDLDGTGASPLKRWSQAFARELESELRINPKFGRELKLFFDSHPQADQAVDPMAALTDQLRQDIGGAALLTVLMSEHYLKSRWCAHEREWWYEKQSALGLTHDERIAVVRVLPTAESWPKTLVDQQGEELLGFSFYDRQREKLEVRPFGWPEPKPTTDGPFRDEILKLVGALLRKIDALKKRIDERNRMKDEVARLAGDAGQVVYLHGRMEQADAWEKASNALARNGLTVLPGEPDAVESDPRKLQEIRHRRVETLSGCDALLLLGTENGRALDADLVVVGRQDRHSARAIANRFLPCGLLDTVGASIATPQRKMAARTLQVDWIDSTQEPWTAKVQSWLTQKSASMEQSL